MDQIAAPKDLLKVLQTPIEVFERTGLEDGTASLFGQGLQGMIPE